MVSLYDVVVMMGMPLRARLNIAPQTEAGWMRLYL
jgi:hypothetical protein